MVKNAYICLYHQNNLFSFDWTVLKTDTVDRDEVLDEIESYPIKLFILKLRSLDCWKGLFWTFSFDQIFLNFTYKMGIKNLVEN